MVANVPHFTSRQGCRHHSINNALHPNVLYLLSFAEDPHSIRSMEKLGKFHNTLHLTSDSSQQQQNFTPFLIIYMNVMRFVKLYTLFSTLHSIRLPVIHNGNELKARPE